MKLLSLTILLLNSLVVFSQNEMSADRPDQTDGANAVDRKHLQVESQFYYTDFYDPSPSFVSANLLRYGLAKSLEARLNIEQGFHRERFISEGGEGGYPLAVGVKYTFLKDKDLLPDIGLIGIMQVPITNRGAEANYYALGVSLAMEKQFNKLNISTNAGIKQHAFEHEYGWSITGDLKYSCTKWLDIFTEYYAEFGKQVPEHHADGGFLFHAGKHWLIFATAGSQIIHPEHFFVSSGFAVDVF